MKYMTKKILLAVAAFVGLTASAHALDANCTNTAALSIIKCPEDSTDWYDSYTDIVDTLDAVGSSVTASTNSFQTQLNAVGVSTTNIAAATTTLDANNLDTATFGVYSGTATTAIATKLDAATFGVYGGTVTTAIALKTDNITFGAYGSTVATAFASVGSSTGGLQVQLNAVGTSTTAIAAATTTLGVGVSAVYWTATHLSTANFSSGFNAANQLVQLDGTARLPAVDGSQLTNLPAAGEANTYGSSKTFTADVLHKGFGDFTYQSSSSPALFVGLGRSSPTIETGVVYFSTRNTSGTTVIESVFSFESGTNFRVSRYANTGGVGGNNIVMRAASGTVVSPAPTGVNGAIGSLIGQILDQNGVGRNVAQIVLAVDTSTGYISGNVPTHLRFLTTSRDGVSAVERCRLVSSGAFTCGVAAGADIATRLELTDTSGSSPVFKVNGANSSVFQMNNAGDLTLTGRGINFGGATISNAGVLSLPSTADIAGRVTAGEGNIKTFITSITMRGDDSYNNVPDLSLEVGTNLDKDAYVDGFVIGQELAVGAKVLSQWVSRDAAYIQGAVRNTSYNLPLLLQPNTSVGAGVGVGVGISTNPATMLDVNGDAQFGSGVTKSTFSISGGLSMPVGANLTVLSSPTFRGQATFEVSSPISTAARFLGGSTFVGNGNASNGSLQVGGDTAALLFDHSNNGIIRSRMVNTWDSNQAEMLFMLRKGANAVTPFALYGDNTIIMLGSPTIRGLATFNVSAGTQAVFKGFSGFGGVQTNGGRAIVGNASGDAGFIDYNTEVLRIGNNLASAGGNMELSLNGPMGNHINILMKNSVDQTAVTVLPNGSPSPTPFAVGSTMTLSSNGTLTIAGASNTNSLTVSSGVLVSAGNVRLAQYNCSGNANGGVLTTTSNGTLMCDDDNATVSSRKLKHNIKPLAVDVAAVLALEPVEFDWNEKRWGHDVGFIAEDVAEAVPSLGVVKDGTPAYRLKQLPAHLLLVIKEQQKTIEAMGRRLDALEKR